MRTILIASIAATGIGLAATSGTSAAPVNGAVIGDLATAPDHLTPVQWGGHLAVGQPRRPLAVGKRWLRLRRSLALGQLRLRRSLAVGQSRMAAVVSCPNRRRQDRDGPDPRWRPVR
jgi:hypothetical protein